MTILFQHTAARRRLEFIAAECDSTLDVSTHSRPKAAGQANGITISRQAGFNTQPPEGGWLTAHQNQRRCYVSTHSRPKAAGGYKTLADFERLFQHTAARRRLGHDLVTHWAVTAVSTHSRPKAAGQVCSRAHCGSMFQHTAARRRLVVINLAPFFYRCFNTQPPEGGWHGQPSLTLSNACFNTQPPEGGWAGRLKSSIWLSCFNTQPPEGGWTLYHKKEKQHEGFNTQPPEGGWMCRTFESSRYGLFQHTAARRRLAHIHQDIQSRLRFQHTAARRRLVPLYTVFARLRRGFNTQPPEGGWMSICFYTITPQPVSTHSRPKAAGFLMQSLLTAHMLFQHTAARRRLATSPYYPHLIQCFNTQPPEGGWRRQITIS